MLQNASAEYGPVMHGFTYSGHPVGGAIGMANLDIMERENLIENSATLGAYFLRSLRERVGDHPHVGSVHGEGLMLAVEFVADKKAKRFFDPKSNAHRIVARKALELGVLTRALPFVEVNSFSPPLCINKSEIDEGVEIYGKAIEAVSAELKQLATM